MKNICARVFGPGVNSIPVDAGLLVLRVWLGLMMFTHGWHKLTQFSATAEKFPQFFGLSSTVNLALAVFAEVLCSALLVVGCLTRFAALMLAITMSVAFGLAHQFALSGERSGELAFIYLAGFVALLFAGPGRFSADATLFKAEAKR